MPELKERAADYVSRQDDDDAKKDDARKDTSLDKLLSKVEEACSKMDSFGKRMDAIEEEMRKDRREDDDDDAKKDEEEKSEKKDDAEEEDVGKAKAVVADKKKRARKDESKEEEKEEKKDDDEEEKEEKKDDDDDDAKKDARTDSVSRADLDAVRAMIPKPLTDADYATFAKLQERADDVYSVFGDSAPRPMQGEDPLNYRRRLLGKLKDHSAKWKGIEVAKLDGDVLTIAEDQVYTDARNAGERAVGLPEGQLREVIRPDKTGRRISTFHGTGSFVRQFKRNPRQVTGMKTDFRTL